MDEVLVGDKPPEVPPVLFTLQHDEGFIRFSAFGHPDRQVLTTYRAFYPFHSTPDLSR
ncbi:hypothetical protein ACFLWZ_05700 [Chloroflexota bacterium]